MAAPARDQASQKSASKPGYATLTSVSFEQEKSTDFCHVGRSALAAFPPSTIDSVAPLLKALWQGNRDQWQAEDAARAAQPTEVASIKAEIDRLNVQRHHLIEQIDESLAVHATTDLEVPPLSESLGSALDRLSILTLRIEAFQRQAGSSCSAILQSQCDDLVWAIAVAGSEVLAGQRRPPLGARLKLYGGPCV